MAKETVVVSLRSKGLASFNRQTLDIRHQAINFGIEAFDIVVSYLLTLYNLSWTSWMSLVVSILTTSISMSDGAWLKNRQSNHQADLNKQMQAVNGTVSSMVFYLENGIIMTGSTALAFYLPFLGALFLPLLLLLAMVFWRREQALSHMASFKTHAVSLCLTADAGNGAPALSEGSNIIRKQVFMLLDDLHRYLHHKRPYARHFYLPYSASSDSSSPGNEIMFHVSREMGILLRKVQLSVRDVHGAVQLLRGAGASEAHVQALVQQVTSLHHSIEQLCNIKEMRTPMVLRAMVRWLCVVVFPVFMGFFSFCMSDIIPYMLGAIGLLTIHIQLALAVLTDIVTTMEDPFDDTSLDTLSLFEVLDHVAAMTSPEEAGDTGVSHTTITCPKEQDSGTYAAAPGAVLRSAAPVDSAAAATATSGGSSLGQQQQQQQQQAGGPSSVPEAARPAPPAPSIPAAGTVHPQGQGQGQVVYSVSIPATSVVSGRRQNPSLPMPQMPSNLT